MSLLGGADMEDATDYHKFLKDMQALPWERKVNIAHARIMEFYNRMDGKVFVSFSGGKDSTILLHMVRQLYPDVPAVFVDTGLEYPEIRQFVNQHDNVIILKPEMRFDEVITTYGYPAISKNIAHALHVVMENPNSPMKKHFEKDNGLQWFDMSKWAYLLDSDVRFSKKCCDVMKKTPFRKFQKSTGLCPYTGEMASESKARTANYHGCNTFDGKKSISKPMAPWKHSDVVHYIQHYDLPICSVYGDIVNGQFTGLDRTGCMFCMFGVQMEKKGMNRFQRMKITHPNQYNYCINKLGCGHVMDLMGVKYD